MSPSRAGTLRHGRDARPAGTAGAGLVDTSEQHACAGEGRGPRRTDAGRRLGAREPRRGRGYHHPSPARPADGAACTVP